MFSKLSLSHCATASSCQCGCSGCHGDRPMRRLPSEAVHCPMQRLRDRPLPVPVATVTATARPSGIVTMTASVIGAVAITMAVALAVALFSASASCVYVSRCCPPTRRDDHHDSHAMGPTWGHGRLLLNPLECAAKWLSAASKGVKYCCHRQPQAGSECHSSPDSESESEPRPWPLSLPRRLRASPSGDSEPPTGSNATPWTLRVCQWLLVLVGYPRPAGFQVGAQRLGQPLVGLPVAMPLALQRSRPSESARSGGVEFHRRGRLLGAPTASAAASTAPTPSPSSRSDLPETATASEGERAAAAGNSINGTASSGSGSGNMEPLLTANPTARVAPSLPDREAEKSRVAEVARNVQRNGTVMFTVGTKGYLDMLENWAISFFRLSLHKHFMVFAEDEETLAFCEERWPGQAVHYRVTAEDGVPQVQTNASEANVFGGHHFFTIMFHRPVYIRLLLRLNYSALLLDNDMVFLRDPLPFMPPSLPFHLILQADNSVWGGLGNATTPLAEWWGNDALFRDFLICTCFMLWKPFPDTEALLEGWMDNMRTQGWNASDMRSSDQGHFNIVLPRYLRGANSGNLPLVGLVPPSLFPSGIRALPNSHDLAVDRDEVVFVHVNWIFGKKSKVNRLKINGLWFLNESLPLNETVWVRGKERGTAGGRVEEEEKGGGESVVEKGGESPTREGQQHIDGKSGSGGGSGGYGVQRSRVDQACVNESIKGFIDAARQFARHGIVMLTVVNEGENKLFLNWRASLRSTGMPDDGYVAITSDEGVLQELNETMAYGDVSPHLVLLNWSACDPHPQALLSHTRDVSRATMPATWRLPFLLQHLMDLNLTVIYSSVWSVWTGSPLPFLSTDFPLILRLANHHKNLTEQPYDPAPITIKASWVNVAGRIIPSVFFAHPSPFTTLFLQHWLHQISRMPSNSPQLLFTRVHLNHAVTAVWRQSHNVSEVGILPETAFPCGGQMTGLKGWPIERRSKAVLVLGEASSVGVQISQFVNEELWLIPQDA